MRHTSWMRWAFSSLGYDAMNCHIRPSAHNVDKLLASPRECSIKLFPFFFSAAYLTESIEKIKPFASIWTIEFSTYKAKAIASAVKHIVNDNEYVNDHHWHIVSISIVQFHFSKWPILFTTQSGRNRFSRRIFFSARIPFPLQWLRSVSVSNR